jgi:hypothetical protein
MSRLYLWSFARALPALGMPVHSGARDLRVLSAPGFPCALCSMRGAMNFNTSDENHVARMSTHVPTCRPEKREPPISLLTLRRLRSSLEGRGHQRGLHPSRRAFRTPQDEE